MKNTLTRMAQERRSSRGWYECMGDPGNVPDEDYQYELELVGGSAIMGSSPQCKIDRAIADLRFGRSP